MPNAWPRGTSVNSALLTNGRLGQGIQAVLVLEVRVGYVPNTATLVDSIRHGDFVTVETSRRVEASG